MSDVALATNDHRLIHLAFCGADHMLTFQPSVSPILLPGDRKSMSANATSVSSGTIAIMCQPGSNRKIADKH